MRNNSEDKTMKYNTLFFGMSLLEFIQLKLKILGPKNRKIRPLCLIHSRFLIYTVFLNSKASIGYLESVRNLRYDIKYF
jgi:hypothetical protein